MKDYKALQLSLLAYAAPTWQPWAAPSRIKKLGRCQNKQVSGHLKSRNLKTVLREAGIWIIDTASKRAKALAYEKALRLPPDHPRRQTLAAPSRHRFFRQSW